MVVGGDGGEVEGAVLVEGCVDAVNCGGGGSEKLLNLLLIKRFRR